MLIYFFVSSCQHYQQSARLAVLCCYLATENVMNFVTSQHGGGVCCAFAPQKKFVFVDECLQSKHKKLVKLYLHFRCWDIFSLTLGTDVDKEKSIFAIHILNVHYRYATGCVTFTDVNLLLVMPRRLHSTHWYTRHAVLPV